MSRTRISILAAILAALATPAAAVAPPSAAATVGSDGTLAHGIGVTGASHLSTGVYAVSFTDPSVPTTCAYTASVGAAPGEDIGPNLANVAGSSAPGGLPGDVIVRTYSAKTHALADLPFNIYVAC